MDKETTKKLEIYKAKLCQLLHNATARYRASTVLDKIKDSWLVEEEIFLCGKEKLHTQALRKLISK